MNVKVIVYPSNAYIYLFLVLMSVASSTTSENQFALLISFKIPLKTLNPISAICSFKISGEKYFLSLIQFEISGQS